jgi:4-amino-4-deoxy-L-arabinose transferase-like glycosyltransferase
VTLRRALPAVAGLAALGLALRIWFAVDITGASSMVGDGLEYLGLAHGIADGHGYVSPFTPPGMEAVASAHKPPLYPLLLAVVALFGATGHVPFQVVSALAGTGTVVVCALLAGRIAGPRAAVIAAAVGAVYPVFLVADASLRAESLYGLLIALSLLAAYRAWERPSWGRLAVLGVLIGLATLARSEGLALLLLLGIPIALRAAGESVRLGPVARFAIVTVACVVTLAPWLVRCWIAFDQPIFISTNSGDLIAGANCAAVYSGPRIGSWAFSCATGVTGKNEADVAAKLRRRGFDYARAHKGRLPAVTFARALRPWGLYDPRGEVVGKTFGEGRSTTANWLGLAACWALMVLSVFAFVLLRRRGQPLFILAAPFALVLLVSVTSYGILRFRAPADVALVVLGAIALDALWARVAGRLQAPRSAAASTS